MSRWEGGSDVTTDHITRGILLKSELVGKVKEDVFYFLHGGWVSGVLKTRRDIMQRIRECRRRDHAGWC